MIPFQVYELKYEYEYHRQKLQQKHCKSSLKVRNAWRDIVFPLSYSPAHLVCVIAAVTCPISEKYIPPWWPSRKGVPAS
ncbi:hypothetical protein KQX54_013860 [Cotesia glomerata]|uniref:Uncharacterized protein n=1 Tax=Cotesia glomerata TaxID=32391 RepID=A0AAV7ISF9_COTGL|nr:hypothetical protein KQX54_013860 [Cotesia glomerata]